MIIAQGAMLHALIKHLEKKGLMNDAEFTDLLNLSIQGVQGRDDAAECIAAIKASAGIEG